MEKAKVKLNIALVSVSDKTGVVNVSKRMRNLGIKILSTGGTGKKLKSENVEVTDVAAHTGFPEMMGGRLKTLHPKIHGGLLMRRDNSKDKEETEAQGIEPIDIVIVNLYPFEQTVSKKDVEFEDAIENIDIGGPTMLRAASKNFKDVIVLVDPNDYDKVFDEYEETGSVSYETRYYLARKVFAHTARYDILISTYLGRQAGDGELPDVLNLSHIKENELRYGENPHMKAAVYRDSLYTGLSIIDAKILQGKEMSYNNYLDASAAIDLAKEVAGGTDPSLAVAVIVKHNNPCGVAVDADLCEAYKRAFQVDPTSAFGGVISLNKTVDEVTAREILNLFCEIIIAPGFSGEALKILGEKPNLRLLELDITKDVAGIEMRKIPGGLLVQGKDTGMIEDLKSLEVVTKRKPTEAEYIAMAFAWRICKHMKSNAIIYTSKNRALGIGAGQTSRVDSAKLAAMKAENAGISLENSAVASDAFFPARDGIDVVAEVGARAIIQPGGSIKDQDVIDACNEHGIAMIFTKMRHFRH